MEHTCLNCKSQLVGKYCYQCGQKSNTARLNLISIIREFFLSPFHVDEHGMLDTIRKLLTQPGKSIHEFISGKRLIMFPPFRFLVLSGAFATIVSKYYDLFSFEAEIQLDGALAEYLNHDFFVFVSENTTIINLLSIPIFSLSTYIFFRPLKFNMAENLVLNAYITAQQLWLLVLLFPFFELFPDAKHGIIELYSVATFVYTFVVFVQFFQMKNATGFILSFLALLYAYCIQFLASFGVYKLFEFTHLSSVAH